MTDPAASTQTEKSPSDDPAAVVPAKAEDYSFDLSDKAKGFLGDLTHDPAVAAAREFALGQGMSQGEFNGKIGGLINHLAEKGLLEPTFDPKAEVAALGDKGETRQRELETFLQSVKARGEIDDTMFGEAMSLVPTAAGVKLLEYFKGQMRASAGIDLGNGNQAVDLKTQANEAANDPRYATDRKFKAEADALWMKAYS